MTAAIAAPQLDIGTGIHTAGNTTNNVQCLSAEMTAATAAQQSTPAHTHTHTYTHTHTTGPLATATLRTTHHQPVLTDEAIDAAPKPDTATAGHPRDGDTCTNQSPISETTADEAAP